jgi:DNA primase
VIAGAQPFAEMLFLREIEGQVFETPEKRAGLERRLREAIGLITDDTLRKHYFADAAQRLQAMFGTGRAPRSPQAARDRRPRRGGFFDLGPRVGVAGTPMPAPRLAHKPREPAREIMILAVLVCHPQLLETVWEEIAGMQFDAPTLAQFRSRMLAFPPDAYGDSQALAQALHEAGHGAERERILAGAGRMPNWWCVRSEAPDSDAETVLRQCLALQRKSGALHKELKLAAAALEADPTEQNLARLLDIKASIADLADAEAAIEGFGALSGRQLPPI